MSYLLCFVSYLFSTRHQRLDTLSYLRSYLTFVSGSNKLCRLVLWMHVFPKNSKLLTCTLRFCLIITHRTQFVSVYLEQFNFIHAFTNTGLEPSAKTSTFDTCTSRVCLIIARTFNLYQLFWNNATLFMHSKILYLNPVSKISTLYSASMLHRDQLIFIERRFYVKR